ncbi:MAG: rhodanese-like domain-containing protein [Deltaproteobacteria bacterium]|nr:rhodanese-like domain-containing protein [Deltaproteobacteria bacterium]
MTLPRLTLTRAANLVRPALGPLLALILLAGSGLPVAAAAKATPAFTPTWWADAAREADRDGYRLLTQPELQALLDSGDEFLLLDVRPDYEYRQGHLPGAKNLEFHLGHRSKLDPATEKAFRALAGPDPGRKIVIYCRSFR